MSNFQPLRSCDEGNAVSNDEKIFMGNMSMLWYLDAGVENRKRRRLRITK